MSTEACTSLSLLYQQSMTHKKRRQKQQKYSNEKQEVNRARISDYQYLNIFYKQITKAMLHEINCHILLMCHSDRALTVSTENM